MGSIQPVEISVVSPVYESEAIVPELIKRLLDTMERMQVNFEIILVEDGSRDNSWGAIKEGADIETRIRGLKLSRNFGQQYAITAGLDHARGNHVVVMDCDLQDDPSDIPVLYEKAMEGNDVVFGVKRVRRHSPARNFLSGFFSRIFNWLSDNQNADAAEGAFTVLSRKVVNCFCAHKDVHRHYLIILRSMGFQHISVEVNHQPRFEGKSSYSLKRLVALAVDGVTSQSTKLLHFSIWVGLIYFIASLAGIVYLLINYFSSGAQTPPGWASLIIVLLGSTGLILMAIGITGIYIGNIYEQTKGRPLYMVSEYVNCAEESECP